MSELEIRNTAQRDAILEYLKSVRSHPTALQIFKFVSKKVPHISRGTVYRNLDILTKIGFVRQLDVYGTTRFESLVDMPDHAHFMCERCKKVIDVKIDKGMLSKFKKEHPEFETNMIAFRGKCDKCNGGILNGRKTYRNK